MDEGAPASGSVQVNTFIADQAALQLRILGRAEAERHRRFENNVDAFRANMNGFEYLNWVRVGQLVSIPQPGHERFKRQNKWAVLRRGPYEIMAAEGTTLMLRDRIAAQEGRQARWFQWPSRWVFPYHVINEEALEVPEPPPPEDDSELPEMQMQGEPELVSAIVGAEPLPDRQRWPIPTVPDNVRNFRFWVRWAGKPHTENSWEPYERVWHTHAFQEFVAGWPEAIGHVRPSAYAQRHRNHVNALLRGRQPRAADGEVLLPEAVHVAAVMQGYLPLVTPTPKSREHVVRSQNDGRASQQSVLQRLSQEQSDEEEADPNLSQQSHGEVAALRPGFISTDAPGVSMAIYRDDLRIVGPDGHESWMPRMDGDRVAPPDFMGLNRYTDAGTNFGREVQPRAANAEGDQIRDRDMPGLVSDSGDEGSPLPTAMMVPRQGESGGLRMVADFRAVGQGGVNGLVNGFRTLARSRDRTPPKEWGGRARSVREVD